MPGDAGEHRAAGAAAGFLDNGLGGHHAAPVFERAGMNTAMTMPSLRQTVKDNALASKTIAADVAIAAPHRPNAGISTTLRPTLSASVAA